MDEKAIFCEMEAIFDECDVVLNRMRERFEMTMKEAQIQ